MNWWNKSHSKNSKTKSKRSLQDILRKRKDSPKAAAAVVASCSSSPKLTRARKLRHLSDDELTIGGPARPSLDLASESGSPRDWHWQWQSPCPSPSPSTPVSRTPRNLVAQPLPLPHDLPAGGGRIEASGSMSPLGHSHYDTPPLPLPMPKQDLSRTESDDVDGSCWGEMDSTSSDGLVESSEGSPRLGFKLNYRPNDREVDGKAVPLTSEKVSHFTAYRPSVIEMNHKSPEQTAQSVGFDLGKERKSIKELKGGVAKSAPTTAFSSPALSPRRLSSGDVLLGRNFKAANGQELGTSSSVPLLGQNWMAEMIAQHSSDKNPISPDPSPLQSPRIKSPVQRSRIHTGAMSPLQSRLASDFSTGWHDDVNNVHPLPLPPSNTIPVGPPPLSPSSPSAVVQRSSGRIETSVTPGRWQKGKLLGSGTFGTVYVGFNRETGDMCAMKEVPLVPDDSRSSESIKQLEQEINLLSGLEHPNIVQYHGSETVEDLFYIYLEYVPGGSIHKLINDYGPLEEPVIRIYTRQILSGLAYLHSMNTVHRDIKGGNLLVDTSGRVKLADFGMAKHINGPATPLSLKGSPYWMAPEVLMQKNTGHDLAVDIWSLGCTVIEMATGKPPWSEYEGAAAMFKVFKSEVPPIPDSLSPEGRNFVYCCLCRNPAQRPTASQLLEHAFVKNATQQDNSDLLASATSGIKSLNILHSPRDKNVYASDTTGMSPVLHSANGKQHQTPSENCYPKIGIFSHYSNPQLSPRSTLEPFSSLSPPRPVGMRTGGAFPNNGFLTGVTKEGPLTIPRSPRGRDGCGGVLNIAGHSEFSNDLNWTSPFTRTPEGSPRRRDLMPDIDRIQINVGRLSHEFEEEHRSRQHDLSGVARENMRQFPVRTSAYPADCKFP